MEVGPGSEGRCVGRSARHLSGGTASGHGRLLRLTLAQLARLRRPDDRPWALVETLAEFLAMDEPRRHVGAMIAGLDIRYDFGGGHPLLGRRMPDLDLVVADVATRVSALLHAARPVLIDFGPGGHFEAPRWADRVRFVKAEPVAAWSLPGVGSVQAPAAVLIRPDGHVVWVGAGTGQGLVEAIDRWFGRAGQR